MALNPSPHVADCREIARKWGMQQVVIVGINTHKGTFEVSSFGETKALCSAAKKLNNRIFRMLESGQHEIDMDAYELASLRQLAATTPKDDLAAPLMESRIAELSNRD
jgi:hypothetical protein